MRKDVEKVCIKASAPTIVGELIKKKKRKKKSKEECKKEGQRSN